MNFRGRNERDSRPPTRPRVGLASQGTHLEMAEAPTRLSVTLDVVRLPVW
jgi:hypothetical protein